MTKLNISTTEVSRMTFASDLEEYASRWVISVKAEIYKMADEIYANPMLVNILHEWAVGEHTYKQREEQLNYEMACYYIHGEEPYYGTDFEGQHEMYKSLYRKDKYEDILADCIFFEASERAGK